MTVVSILKSLARNAGSQNRAAQKLKCHPAMFSRWIRKVREPSKAWEEKIRKAVERVADN